MQQFIEYHGNHFLMEKIMAASSNNVNQLYNNQSLYSANQLDNNNKNNQANQPSCCSCAANSCVGACTGFVFTLFPVGVIAAISYASTPPVLIGVGAGMGALIGLCITRVKYPSDRNGKTSCANIFFSIIGGLGAGAMIAEITHNSR